MKMEGNVIVGEVSHARPVRLSDAEFILELRQQSKAQRFLSPTSTSLDDQRQWLAGYLKRNERGEDYYFVVLDQAERDCGLVRIYNVNNCECTAGSWLMREGTDPMITMEAYLLPMFFAFEILALKMIHIDVRNNNAKVLAWHKFCGAEFVRSDEIDHYFDYSLSTYEALKEKLGRLVSPRSVSGPCLEQAKG